MSWKDERNAMLMRGDLAEMRKWMVKATGRVPSSDVVEITLHKCRLESLGLPAEMRRESANWLLMRGLRRRTGEQVPLPNEPLPE